MVGGFQPELDIDLKRQVDALYEEADWGEEDEEDSDELDPDQIYESEVLRECD